MASAYLGTKYCMSSSKFPKNYTKQYSKLFPKFLHVRFKQVGFVVSVCRTWQLATLLPIRLAAVATGASAARDPWAEWEMNAACPLRSCVELD